MKSGRFLTICAGIIAAGILFCLCTAFFVPATQIEGVIVRGLARQGYVFRARSFARTFPLGIRATQVEVADDRGDLLRFDRVSVRISMLPLLFGRIEGRCRTTLNRGDITCGFALWPQTACTITMNNIRLEDIPWFATVAGVKVKGELRGTGSFKGSGNAARGELRTEVKGADLREVRIGGVALPDAGYDTVQGALKVDGGRAIVESVTLKGSGLYARLKGTVSPGTPIGSSPLNLTLELMPKSAFLEEQKLIFLLLLKYQSSPGVYTIPVRGLLASPTLQQ